MVISGTVARGVTPILVVFPIHIPTQVFKCTRVSKLLNLDVSTVNRRCWVCTDTVSAH